MKATVLFFSLLFPFLAAGQEARKESNDGLAIQLGAGYAYGGNIGLSAEWQFFLIDRLHLTPFVSFGIAEGGTDSLSHRYYWWGYASGANLEFGKKHRIMLGTHLAGQFVNRETPDVLRSRMQGLSIIAGYKGYAGFGLMWQLYVGDIYIQYPDSEDDDYHHNSRVGLGIGYKF